MKGTEGQDIERQLTSEELEAIAGGYNFQRLQPALSNGETEARLPSISDVYNFAKDTLSAKIGGGEQLVQKTLGQLLSAEQLQQMDIPADARIVKYVGATTADADFVKQFKAASGLDNNAKVGYLQVEYSSQGVTVHDNLPLIDLGEPNRTPSIIPNKMPSVRQN